MKSIHNAKYFGEKVGNLLVVNHWTQKKLARKAKITEAAVSQLINGGRRPTLETACRIANAFEISLEHLVTA